MRYPTTCILICAVVGAPVAAAPALPLWEVGVIGGTVSMPAYPASADRSTRGIVFPYLVYRGKVFRSDESGLLARVLRTERMELDMGFAASLPTRSGAVDAREGMPNLGALGEFGPRLKVKVGNPDTTKVRFELPVRAVVEARGGLHHRGWTAEPRLTWGTEDPARRLSVGTSFSAVFGDRSINRYFYEVAPQYATPARPAYAADSGLVLLRLGASANYKLTRDVRLYGYVRAESYSRAANRDSPLHLKSTGIAGGFAVAWIMKRSSRPAAD
ncbi:MipA/OmpV family protein [Pseudoduganella sp. GCM10020061]|uniref:MipA/OmpV family protein n=1 Tax=Pseudoduganella sp. GCM10020061 TaxID=3317345 RepID=UPI0036408662